MIDKKIQEFIKKSKEIHGNLYDYSLVVYINNRTKVKIICEVHGIFEQLPTNHLSGSKCSKCQFDKKRFTREEFIEKSKEIHGENNIDYSLVVYINCTTKVKLICKDHGIFEQIPDNHLSKGVGCPNCNESHGEREISILLKKMNIMFNRQHKFDGCKDKRKLPFDFYLTDYNTCIEFDGKQHFNLSCNFGGIDTLDIIIKHDKIKNEYCLNNNINLLRIKYDENIKEILDKWVEKV